MAEEKIYTEEYQYNDLAEQFSKCKRDSIIGLLKMGKIFVKAKQELDHGKFLGWLKDTRVNVSTRTAQRTMAIYSNFRHLLNNPEENKDLFLGLDFTHMLELRKLPQRFKKSIEIEEEGHKQTIDVVDEKKVSEFLNKPVNINGKIKVVRDLPVAQLKQQIQDVGGEYKDLAGTRGETEDTKQDNPKSVNLGYKAIFKIVLDISSKTSELMKELDKIDDVTLYEMLPNDKEKMKKELRGLSELSKGLVVKCEERAEMI